VIKHGRKVGNQRTLMPAFLHEKGGTLTKQQIEVFVFEITGTPYKLVLDKEAKASEENPIYKAVADPKGKAPKRGAPAPLPKDAPADKAPPAGAGRPSADYERITKTVFARACADGHGPDGKGTKKVDGTKKVGAINEPAFLALVSDQALRRIMITG